MTVLYFGPDRQDPAVRRRVAQWRHAGCDVLAFAFSRTRRAAKAAAARVADGMLPDKDPETDYIDLGHLEPQSRFGRLISIALACVRLISVPRRPITGISPARISRSIRNTVLAISISTTATSSLQRMSKILRSPPMVQVP